MTWLTFIFLICYKSTSVLTRYMTKIFKKLPQPKHFHNLSHASKTMSSPVLSDVCVYVLFVCYILCEATVHIFSTIIERNVTISQSPIHGMPLSVVLSRCFCYPWVPLSVQLCLSATHGSQIRFPFSVLRA